MSETIAKPDLRELDPLPGRERFYRRRVTDRVRWMRVVVDSNDDPAVIVTAFVQRRDGELRITWPDGHVSHEDREAAFAAAG